MGYRVLVASCTVAVLAVACQKDKPQPTDVQIQPYPTARVSITPDTATLLTDDSIRVQVTYTDVPAGVTFKSSNTEVAVVTGTGLVRAIGPGMALITATSTAKPGALDATLLKVVERQAPNTPAELERIGSGETRYYTTAEVAYANGYAYTTTCCTWDLQANKTFIWNVQGTTPVMVDSIDLGGVFYVGDVTVSDDKKLLLISSDAGSQPGVAVYSIDNPAKPVFRDRWIGPAINDTTPDRRRGTHTAKFGRVNGKLYVFATNSPNVIILDASDPSHLRVVRDWRAAGDNRSTHDVLVRDGLLFTGDYDTFGVWDVGGAYGGSVQNPVLLARPVVPGTYMHNFWWMQDQQTGSKRYLFVGDEGFGYFPVRTSGDIHVFDISSITAPREVAFFHVLASTTSNYETAGPHNFSADEQNAVLYSAFYNGGVRAIDARGDLSKCQGFERARDGRCDLRLMGRELARGLVDGHSHGGVVHRGEVGIWGVAYDNGRVYASDMLHGLHILDASEVRK